MASPRFVAIESTTASRFLRILPVKRQKVKGIGPGPLEVLIGSRKQEPARTTDRTVITTSLGHEVYTRLEKLQSLCGRDIRAQTHSLSHESINAELMIMTHDLITIAAAGREIT